MYEFIILRLLISSVVIVTYMTHHKSPSAFLSRSVKQKRFFLYTGVWKLNEINYAKGQGKMTAERHFGAAGPTE